ncbi:hypothetical protein IWW56_005105 [Coemansia sp. RSA 2131]|nr:hypothetical protein IWW56_005105 [Coemansia sp. RSA 2131]
MNSQFSAYDGTSTTATAAAANDPALTIGMSFAGVPDDYEGYDNARVRKRRLTVSDERRVEDLSAFHFSDANASSLFGILDQHHSGSAGPAQSDIGSLMSGSGLSSLPIPPGSEGSSFGGALNGSMGFGGINLPHNTYTHSGSASDSDGNPSHTTSTMNPLSPPVTGRAGARKHQSLSIAIGREGYNE